MFGEAVHLWGKVGVVVFPVASWNMCSVCGGDDGVEVCYCGVYIGDWCGVYDCEQLFSLLRKCYPVSSLVVSVCFPVLSGREACCYYNRKVIGGKCVSCSPVVFCSSVGEQKVISVDDVWYCARCVYSGMEYYYAELVNSTEA